MGRILRNFMLYICIKHMDAFINRLRVVQATLWYSMAWVNMENLKLEPSLMATHWPKMVSFNLLIISDLNLGQGQKEGWNTFWMCTTRVSSEKGSGTETALQSNLTSYLTNLIMDQWREVLSELSKASLQILSSFSYLTWFFSQKEEYWIIGSAHHQQCL